MANPTPLDFLAIAAALGMRGTCTIHLGNPVEQDVERPADRSDGALCVALSETVGPWSDSPRAAGDDAPGGPVTIAGLWLACALIAGLLGGIVWSGWRHAPGARTHMLVASAVMAVVAAWRFIEAVSR